MFVTGIAAGVVVFVIFVAAMIVLLPFLIGALNRRRRHAGWLFLALLLIFLLLAKEYERNGWPWPTPSGTIDFEIGKPLSRTIERSSYTFPKSAGIRSIISTNDVVDLRFRIGDRVVAFPKTGGMSSATLMLGLDIDGDVVRDVSFVDQHRPLTLEEALKRAEATKAKLDALGFEESEPSFAITERTDRRTGQRAPDWAAARRWLADDEGILAMRLYSLEAHGVSYSAELRSMARHGSSIYDHNFGREWLLSVWIGEVWDPAGFEPDSTQAGN